MYKDGAIIAGYLELSSGRSNQGFRVRNVEREMRREMPVSARDYASLRYLSTMVPYRPRPRSFPGQSGVSEALIRPFP